MVQTIAPHSPFKFLDSYGQEDRAIFFGREEEIDALYELVMSSQLTLVYGASGTGKTSLIECGLSNRFSETDWFAIRIRKGDDITESTFQAIRDRTYPDKVIADTEGSIFNAVQALYIFYYIPIYLIFDQFEELFISGTHAEQEKFFLQLKKVLESGKPCKVILVMREEYIAYLSSYEHLIPSLFNSKTKYRIEKMNQLKLQTVVMGTIQAPQYNIIFEEPEKNTNTIIENLRNERREVDLTNLQVYLDRLYSEDLKRKEQNNETRPVTFDTALIEEKVGKLPQVLSDFLEEQMTIVDKILDSPNISLTLLSAFVTNEGTKQSCHLSELVDKLKIEKNIPPSVSHACIQKFYEKRILRELKMGDDLQYEITHDLLARQIHNRFSAEEKDLRKATSRIQDAYDFHAELSKNGEGISFMTEEQLAYLQNILPKLSLSETLLSYFEDSKDAVTQEKEKEKLMLQKEVALQKQQLEQEQKAQALQQALMEQERREHIRNQEEIRKAHEQARTELKYQQKRNRIAFLVGLLILGLSIVTIFEIIKVKKQKSALELQEQVKEKLYQGLENTNRNLEKAKQDILNNEKDLYKAFIAKGETNQKAKLFTQAITEFEGALRFNMADSLKIKELIRQCNLDNNHLKKQEVLQKQFDEFIRQGSKILEAETQKHLLMPEAYIIAREKFDSAYILLAFIDDEKNKVNAKDKKDEVERRINNAFDAYTDKAERFKKAKGWKDALSFYHKAKTLKPNDEPTLKAIKECEYYINN